GREASTGGQHSIAIGREAIVGLGANYAVAIGSGARVDLAANNAVAIGPGAIANEANTIVLGTSDHVVIIPGNLKVLGDLQVLGGAKTSLSWIAPSDDIIAEIPTPIVARADDKAEGLEERSLTLRNPGR